MLTIVNLKLSWSLFSSKCTRNKRKMERSGHLVKLLTEWEKKSTTKRVFTIGVGKTISQYSPQQSLMVLLVISSTSTPTMNPASSAISHKISERSMILLFMQKNQDNLSLEVE